MTELNHETGSLSNRLTINNSFDFISNEHTLTNADFSATFCFSQCPENNLQKKKAVSPGNLPVPHINRTEQIAFLRRDRTN
jgi:hypothetical protein